VKYTVDRVNIDNSRNIKVLRKDGHSLESETLLLIHGLGDSSLAWKYLFEKNLFPEYRVLAPDLPGYGESITENLEDFNFSLHVNTLLELLKHYESKRLIIFGHSMGGVIASILSAVINSGINFDKDMSPESFLTKYKKSLVVNKIIPDIELKAFVNVEGNLTDADATISGRAMRANNKNNFDRWFKNFCKTTVSGNWSEENPKLEHYGISVNKCNPKAFLQGSLDLNSWKEDCQNSNNALAGELYKNLNVSKFYVYGSVSSPEKSKKFVLEEDLDKMEVAGSGHWIMNDNSEIFYSEVKKWLKRIS